MYKLFFTCFLTGALAIGVKAQKKDSTIVLDQVKVKGKTITRQVLEQPYTVSSISTEQLKNGISDAKSILDKVPGIRVLQDGGLGSDFSITLNGFSGQNVKIFLDGIPIDQYGSSFNLGNIPVNAIERIDVYKGVVPVELGTDALGGVINIITNRKKNYLDASYSYGSFNTHRASLNGAYHNPENGWLFRGSANYNYSDNDYKVFVPIVRNNVDEGNRDVRRFHDRYYSGNIKLETGLTGKSFADQLLFGVILSADDQQVQNGNTMTKVYGGIVENSKNVAGSVKYSKKNLLLDGLNLNFYTSYNRQKNNIIDSLQGITYNWLGETTKVEGSNQGEKDRTYTTLNNKELDLGLNLGYVIQPNHAIAFNYQFTNYHRDVFDKYNPNKIENTFPKSLNKGVLGLAYNVDVSNKWKNSVFGKFYALQAQGDKLLDFASATQRTELVKSNITNFGYGVASTFFPAEGLQLKASYEAAVRMPLPEEIFGNGLFIEPNLDLKPERSNNINFTATYDFQKLGKNKLSIGSSFIYRNAEDLIYTVVALASPVTRYGNINNARTMGVEGNISYNRDDFFTLNVNVTYQDITDQSDFIHVTSTANGGLQTNYQKGFRMPNTPYFFGNANAGFNFKNVGAKNNTLNVTYLFNYVEPYFLTWSELGSREGNNKNVIPQQLSHDIEASYSIKKGKYNIGLQCFNITNERLYDKFLLQKPGRSFYAKLRYTL